MLVLAFSCWKEVKAALGGSRPPLFSSVLPWKRGERECLLLVTGIGPLKAFHSLQKLLCEQQVTGVVNLGLGGSYDLQALPLGTITLVTHEIWPETNLRSGQSIFFRALQKLDKNILTLDPFSAASSLGLRIQTWRQARSVTVSGVSDRERSCRLQTDYGALVENMEGFSLALACQLASVPFLELRTISNLTGESSRNKHGFSLACPALQVALSGLGL